MKSQGRASEPAQAKIGTRRLEEQPAKEKGKIKGFTRALVLRRGGRTDRGLAPAPGVDRVKSAGIMQIQYIGPFPSLLDEWGGLEGAFRSTVPRSEGLGR